MLHNLLQKRIRMIQPTLQDPTLRISPWFQRFGLQNADEKEIMARFTGTVVAADLIADDAVAVVKSAEPVTMSELAAPNLKHGINIGTEQLTLINALTQVPAGSGLGTQYLSSLDSYLQRKMQALRDGCLQRAAMITAAMVSGVLNYDGYGIKLTNVSWGSPAALRVSLTTTRRWIAGNEATAKPITDILALRQAQIDQGTTPNRVTMSLARLMFVVTTTEFQALAQTQYVTTVSAATIATQNSTDLGNMLGRMLGMAVEIDDTKYTVESTAGARTKTRFTPDDVVILSDSGMDGDLSIADFANAPIPESLVAASMPGSDLAGMFGGATRGPVAWAEGQTNPAGVQLWANLRGFARQHDLSAFASLDVE